MDHPRPAEVTKVTFELKWHKNYYAVELQGVWFSVTSIGLADEPSTYAGIGRITRVQNPRKDANLARKALRFHLRNIQATPPLKKKGKA